MGTLALTGAAIADPFVQVVDGAVNVLPGIIAAIVILIIGYIVGAVVGYIVEKALERVKLVKWVIDKTGLQSELGKWNINEFLGLITKWYVFVIFLNPAAQVVELTALAEFFSSAALWIPNIILAIVIAMAGYVLAEYIAKKIKQIKSKSNSLLASSAKVLTLIFVVIMALKQIGVEVSIAENAFLIVLAGIMLGLGLAFGFAFKDDAKGLVKDVRKRL